VHLFLVMEMCELHASLCEMLMPRLQKPFIVQRAHGALLQGNDGALP
jgi:hypothetical protein